ncbi:MAG: Spy/CpxP family protein refolding chaperone [Pseudomonadota bacterium]|nr:Spy/CpxP family protein refolding chaperone [Pseudomonadota bacterium]
MPSSPMRFSLIVGAAILLGSAGAGLAQNQYGPPPGPPGANGEPPTQTPASQATRLRQTLRLRPDQETALQTFIHANAPPPGAMDRMRRQEENAANLPTPQRLDFMLANMDEMRGLMVTRMAATKRFYAQLTPAQQRAFDALGSTSGSRGYGGPSR